MAVSLLSKRGGTHTVTVILYRAVVDDRGKTTKAEVGRVLATGRLQPSTSADVERYASAGVAVYETMRFICKNYPGDDLSEVIDAEGVRYEVVGAPRRHRSSRATHRDIVLLSAKTQKRKW